MSAAQNHLIELLPRNDRRRLLAICEPVELTMSEVLYESGERIRRVYFPIDSTISLVTPIDGKPALEVGMVGREGMVGVQLILGVMTTPLHAVVQGSGNAWCVGVTAVSKANWREVPRCGDAWIAISMFSCRSSPSRPRACAFISSARAWHAGC